MFASMPKKNKLVHTYQANEPNVIHPCLSKPCGTSLCSLMQNVNYTSNKAGQKRNIKTKRHNTQQSQNILKNLVGNRTRIGIYFFRIL